MADQFDLNKLKATLRRLLEVHRVFLVQEAKYALKALRRIRCLHQFDAFLLDPENPKRTESKWAMFSETDASLPSPEKLVRFYDDTLSMRDHAFFTEVWKPFAFAIDTLRGVAYNFHEQKAMGYLMDKLVPGEVAIHELKEYFLHGTELHELEDLAKRISELVVKPIEGEELVLPPNRFEDPLDPLYHYDLGFKLEETTSMDDEERLWAVFESVSEAGLQRNFTGRVRLIHALMQVPALVRGSASLERFVQSECVVRCQEFRTVASHQLPNCFKNLIRDDPALIRVFDPIPPFLAQMCHWFKGKAPEPPTTAGLKGLIHWIRTQDSSPGAVTAAHKKLLVEIGRPGELRSLTTEAVLASIGHKCVQFVILQLLAETRTARLTGAKGEALKAAINEFSKKSDVPIEQAVEEFKPWAERFLMSYHAWTGNEKAVDWQVRNLASFSCVYRHDYFIVGTLMHLRAKVWYHSFTNGLGLEQSQGVAGVAEQIGRAQGTEVGLLGYLLANGLLDQEDQLQESVKRSARKVVESWPELDQIALANLVVQVQA